MKRISKHMVFFLFIFFSSIASAIIIEPDDYAEGTDLSNISPYVKFSTVGGLPVYSSNIGEAAAGGHPTGPLGQRVFSSNPSTNSEWYYWRGEDEAGGFMITFHQPIVAFSLIFAELFSDAGCCMSDPIYLYLFSSDDTLIDVFCGDCGEAQYLGNTEDPEDAWPYWRFTYRGDEIWKIIVGGESEPTTIDRLEFSLSEPPLLACLALGLIPIVGRRILLRGKIWLK